MYKYISCRLAKAAYPREAKDLNLESLRGRRAAVSLARVDAGQGGPGQSERETLMGCDCWPANDVEPEEREAASDGVEPFS